MAVTARWVVAGTGPRALQDWPPTEKRRTYGVILAAIDGLRRQHGDLLTIMSGMALGFDKALAMAALELNVPLWCAIPNRGYGRYYWRDRHAEFQRIVDRAAQVTYVMEDVHHTSALRLGGRHANMIRNLWMLDQAQQVIAWPSTSGGTAHCLRAARIAGLPILDVTQRQQNLETQ